jgi:hypothetical protein
MFHVNWLLASLHWTNLFNIVRWIEGKGQLPAPLMPPCHHSQRERKKLLSSLWPFAVYIGADAEAIHDGTDGRNFVPPIRGVSFVATESRDALWPHTHAVVLQSSVIWSDSITFKQPISNVTTIEIRTSGFLRAFLMHFCRWVFSSAMQFPH